VCQKFKMQQRECRVDWRRNRLHPIYFYSRDGDIGANASGSNGGGAASGSNGGAADSEEDKRRQAYADLWLYGEGKPTGCRRPLMTRTSQFANHPELRRNDAKAINALYLLIECLKDGLSDEFFGLVRGLVQPIFGLGVALELFLEAGLDFANGEALASARAAGSSSAAREAGAARGDAGSCHASEHGAAAGSSSAARETGAARGDAGSTGTGEHGAATGAGTAYMEFILVSLLGTASRGSNIEADLAISSVGVKFAFHFNVALVLQPPL
jgi:hypothetical protein